MSFPDNKREQPQGWKAELNLRFKKKAQQTVLASRSQKGPLTVQRPFYPEGDVCHLYLLHPPGGVVGGDELRINVALADNANTLLTTPGATKFYRNTGRLAHQLQTLSVADNCSLEWFPQENIFFNKTHTQLSTRVDLSQSACFMGWEINCYGRPASGEVFESGQVLTRLELYRENKPLVLDSLFVSGENGALSSPAGMNNFPCYGTFISTHATQDLLEKSREAVSKRFDTGFNNSLDIQQQVGITLIDDILVARCLGQYSEQVSTTLKAVWSALRPVILDREVCCPRIWST